MKKLLTVLLASLFATTVYAQAAGGSCEAQATEKKLAGAAKEVRDLLDEARRDAEHTKQEILTEAKAGADAERARALRDIEAAADAAVKSLAERSTELAVELAGKIVQTKLNKDDHARLIEEAMAKFPASTPGSN